MLKKPNRLVITGFFLCILWVLIGCQTVPVSGRRQLNYVPGSLVRSMSFQNYTDFLKENKLSTDVEKTAMVKRVGSRIQRAVEDYFLKEGGSDTLDGYEWDFNLVEDDAVNAWAMPGGKVVVYTGLLKVAKDETDLAVVLGHEVAHAVAKHGSERMSQQLAFAFGAVALDTAMKDQPEKTRKIFLKSYGVGGEVGVLLSYSRLHESEADQLGLIFMSLANYNPERAVNFWQAMAEQSKGGAPPELLSTHPSHETRIRKIKEYLPSALIYYTGPM